MSLEKYVDYLVSFLKDYARPFNGYILGVSGGLDSAVVAKI
jgi:NH3-dependent NAD+ synthetase